MILASPSSVSPRQENSQTARIALPKILADSYRSLHESPYHTIYNILSTWHGSVPLVNHLFLAYMYINAADITTGFYVYRGTSMRTFIQEVVIALREVTVTCTSEPITEPVIYCGQCVDTRNKPLWSCCYLGFAIHGDISMSVTFEWSWARYRARGTDCIITVNHNSPFSTSNPPWGCSVMNSVVVVSNENEITYVNFLIRCTVKGTGLSIRVMSFMKDKR